MICSKCGDDKDLLDFYVNDKTCKECRKARVRANRAAKADYYRKYDRERANRPDRVKARKEYQKTEGGKESHKRASKRWVEKNTVKRAAHILVGNKMRSGDIVKQPCEICGSSKVHAHHDDYAKPLEVRWLCDTHHNEWHKQNGEGLNA